MPECNSVQIDEYVVRFDRTGDSRFEPGRSMVSKEVVTHHNRIEYKIQTIKSTSLPQHPIYSIFNTLYIRYYYITSWSG